MKRIAIALTTLFALPAHAELTKLGDWSIGSPVAKQQFLKSTTVLGCTGSLRQVGAKGKVTDVVFSPDSKCDKKALEAAIAKEFGGKPIVSTDKSARLWEGKTASVIVMQTSTGETRVSLLAPGPGAKRPCFADDGFAAFLKTFIAAIDKPDAAVATFKFPVKDFDDTVVAKDAKALKKKWASMIDPADKKGLASGKLTPTCDVDTGSYDLRLPDSNVSFEARRTGETWQWVEINDEASG